MCISLLNISIFIYTYQYIYLVRTIKMYRLLIDPFALSFNSLALNLHSVLTNYYPAPMGRNVNYSHQTKHSPPLWNTCYIYGNSIGKQ